MIELNEINQMKQPVMKITNIRLAVAKDSYHTLHNL